jgi:hypothetical protein
MGSGNGDGSANPATGRARLGPSANTDGSAAAATATATAAEAEAAALLQPSMAARVATNDTLPEDAILFRGMRVRVAIVTGEPVCDMDEITEKMTYHGPMIEEIGALLRCAHGGQTLLTETASESSGIAQLHANADKMNPDSGEAKNDDAGAAPGEGAAPGGPTPGGDGGDHAAKPQQRPTLAAGAAIATADLPSDLVIVNLGKVMTEGFAEPIEVVSVLPAPLALREFPPLRVRTSLEGQFDGLKGNNSVLRTELENMAKDAEKSAGMITTLQAQLVAMENGLFKGSEEELMETIADLRGMVKILQKQQLASVAALRAADNSNLEMLEKFSAMEANLATSERALLESLQQTRVDAEKEKNAILSSKRGVMEDLATTQQQQRALQDVKLTLLEQLKQREATITTLEVVEIERNDLVELRRAHEAQIATLVAALAVARRGGQTMHRRATYLRRGLGIVACNYARTVAALPRVCSVLGADQVLGEMAALARETAQA